MFDEFLDDADGIWPHYDFVMLGSIFIGHHPGIGQFVEAALFEADGERLDGLRRLQRHGRHHGTGIDAAAQEGAQRHVGDHADAHGFVELFADTDHRVGMREAGRGFGDWRRHLPVAALPDRAAFVGEPASGGNAADGAIGGQRIRNVIELEVEAQRLRVGLQRNTGLAQAGDFTAEPDAVGEHGVVQRLLAEAVAGQQQAALAGIPDGKGEHAPKPLEALHALLFVQVNQRLGIAGGAELMPARHEIGAQFLVAVNLAVEDDPHRTVLIGDRLMAGGEIDDAEAAHADPAPAIHVNAFVVRTAMANLVAHRLYQRRLSGLIETHKTGDSAHRRPGREVLLRI